MKNHPPVNSNSSIGKITFHGAAMEVTGSCHLLETNGNRILLDCGMRQGGSAIAKNQNGDFDFDPSSIDAVVLSHAHLDHSGSLPKLVAKGFSGPIYCTTGTRKLLRIMLEDSYGLYLSDVERENVRNRRSGNDLVEMLYDEKDVEKVLSLCKSNDYGDPIDIETGISLNYYDAGHIMGSAIVELKITKGEVTKTLVFSGDLGNAGTALMPNPELVEYADVVLLESTYGNRNHRDKDETLLEFKRVIEQASKTNGNILIPAFAVGRTQELLFQLGCLYQQGHLKGWKVFLDSPMASAVTDVYNEYLIHLKHKDTELMHAYGSMRLEEFLPSLTVTKSVEESMQINEVESNAIIIAGSGMVTGGRIKHHLKHRIWKENTHLLFVGFQAYGTVGRKLVDGMKKIKFFGQEFVVKAKVHTIGGFSAHAGQDELIEWVSAIKGNPKVYLVHGEQRALVALADQLLMRSNIEATIAIKGASVYF